MLSRSASLTRTPRERSAIHLRIFASSEALGSSSAARAPRTARRSGTATPRKYAAGALRANLRLVRAAAGGDAASGRSPRRADGPATSIERDVN